MSLAWWRHQMETFSALLAFCAGNSPVTSGFPAKRPVTRSFHVFFDLRLNKGWVNNREADDLRRHQAHYDVIVMWIISLYHLHRAILKKSGGNRFHIEKNIYFSNIELSHIHCYVVCVALIATKVCIYRIHYQCNKYSPLNLYHFHNSRRNKVSTYLYNILALNKKECHFKNAETSMAWLNQERLTLTANFCI